MHYKTLIKLLSIKVPITNIDDKTPKISNINKT